MNTSTSLTQELLAQLQGKPMNDIASQLGTDSQQAGSAVAAALPLLLGALGNNAAQPQGAQALFGALLRDHAPGDQAGAGDSPAAASAANAASGGALGALNLGGVNLGGLLGALLGGGAAASSSAGAGGQSDAGAILGHIFGGNQGRAEAGLGQATGLGGGNAANLLKILAPVVMAFLAQRVKSQGLDSNGLGQVLGQEQAQARQAGGQGGDLLTAVLDQDGDGKLGLNDLLKIGGSLLGGRR